MRFTRRKKKQIKYIPIVAASAKGNECSLVFVMVTHRPDGKCERSEVDIYVHHFLGNRDRGGDRYILEINR